MAISRDNFIVVYIYGNLGSESFANYYIVAHDMTTTTINPSGSSGTTGRGIYWQVDGQKVGIQMDDTSEILSENDFYRNIEEPLLQALNSEELKDRNIQGVVLGYRVPGGYYYGTNIISSTSRISRIKSTFSEKFPNRLYNRQVFKRFDSDDAELLLIVARIDGPNVQFAKNIVDKGGILSKQLFANGTFYIDPYSDRATLGTSEYEDLILDFYNNILPLLNLDNWSTTFMDPYIDVAIPYVEEDSFVWSWFSDRANSSFFQNSSAVRVFFYNADYDGAFTIRDETSKRWPYLSLEAGYVATAGAMSNPTISGFLNLNAFFYALLRGTTIGEAYYFSLPYLDWTMTLFGDPLVYCSFPAFVAPEEDEIGEHEVWNMLSKNLAITAAYLYKKEIELRDILYEVVDLTDLDAELVLLYSVNDLYNSNKIWKYQLKPLVEVLFDFPRLRYYYNSQDTLAPNVNDYLSNHNFKVSRILTSIAGEGIIESDNLLDEGWWQFEFTMIDKDDSRYVNYHFKLEVSSDEDFSNIIISKNSYSIRNWTYEKEKETYSPIIYNGVGSSYIGRKIRYESREDPLIGLDEYLVRGQIYYFRVTPYNIETLVDYSSDDYSDIIYS